MSHFQGRYRGGSVSRIRTLVGGHVNLNAEEISSSSMNCLSAITSRRDVIKTARGSGCRSPEYPFADRGILFKGDNITPPQQALSGFLIFTATSTRSGLRATIVYTFTKQSGTGIFVSAASPGKSTRIFKQHRPDRRAPRPALRGNLQATIRRYRSMQSWRAGKWIMRLSAAPWTIFGRWAAIRRRTTALCHRRPGVRDQSPITGNSCSQLGSRRGYSPTGRLMRNWHPLRISYEAFGRDSAAGDGCRGG
jgi:hypothetical protein